MGYGSRTHFYLGDPLRSAFQSDKDSELSELNFSVSIRAYADRLILESARRASGAGELGSQSAAIDE